MLYQVWKKQNVLLHIYITNRVIEIDLRSLRFQNFNIKYKTAELFHKIVSYSLRRNYKSHECITMKNNYKCFRMFVHTGKELLTSWYLP